MATLFISFEMSRFFMLGHELDGTVVGDENHLIGDELILIRQKSI